MMTQVRLVPDHMLDGSLSRWELGSDFICPVDLVLLSPPPNMPHTHPCLHSGTHHILCQPVPSAGFPAYASICLSYLFPPTLWSFPQPFTFELDALSVSPWNPTSSMSILIAPILFISFILERLDAHSQVPKPSYTRMIYLYCRLTCHVITHLTGQNKMLYFLTLNVELGCGACFSTGISVNMLWAEASSVSCWHLTHLLSDLRVGTYTMRDMWKRPEFCL